MIKPTGSETVAGVGWPSAGTVGASPADSTQERRSVAAAQARVASQTEQHSAVKAAAQKLDAFMRSLGRTLEFSVDEGTGRTVVRVRDTNTGDVVRQIPSEEVLQLAARLETQADSARSVLVDLKV